MKRVIRLTESDLARIVEKVISQTNADEFMRLISSGNNLIPAMVYEQPDTVMDRRVGIEDRNMKALGLDPSKPLDRNIYLMRVYGKAVPEVMEEMRSFLFSDIGAVTQLLALATGIGGLAVESAWAIMLLYDLFLLADGRGNYWNILIDILCLASGGTLSKIFSGIFRGASSSITRAIAKLTESGLTKNPAISKILTNIRTYSRTIMKWFDYVVSKLSNSKAFSWLKGKVSNYKTQLTKFIDDVFEATSRRASVLMSGEAILGKNSAKSLTNFWNTLDPSVAKVFSSENVKAGTLKIIDGYIEKLKNTSIESVLDTIDKNYGTSYGNYFRLYLSGKKLNKMITKGANISSSDLLKDYTVSGGEVISPTQKYTKYVDTISRGGSKNVAKVNKVDKSR